MRAGVGAIQGKISSNKVNAVVDRRTLMMSECDSLICIFMSSEHVLTLQLWAGLPTC